MKQRLFAALSLSTLALMSTACTSGGQDPVVELRFSTTLTPQDIPTQAAERFADLVAEETDGEVRVQVFSGGSLFDQNAEQTALERGDLDMTFAGPQWVSDKVPEADIVSVPYMLDDVNHLYRVMDGEPGEAIFEMVVDEMGIRPLDTLYIGTRMVNLREDSPTVETPSDLAGVKLRVPDRDSWIRMGNALGAKPTPVAFSEVYLALQTGTIDAQETPLPLTFASKLHEVTKQVVLTSHVRDSVWPAMNEETWQDLSSEHQDAIVSSWGTVIEDATDETVKLEQDLASDFEDLGLKVYEPDLDAFREEVLSYYVDDEQLTAAWAPGMYEEIQALREEG